MYCMQNVNLDFYLHRTFCSHKSILYCFTHAPRGSMNYRRILSACGHTNVWVNKVKHHVSSLRVCTHLHCVVVCDTTTQTDVCFIVLQSLVDTSFITFSFLFFYSALQQQEQDPTNLYISNLPVSMDEQELENMLKPLGHVISTRILRDANGVSRGVGFARMESTEKCEVVIQHFNGKYLKTPPGIPAPTEPLLCKFADGGQKKRQSQSKYPQNGRPWHREGETGMALTYDPAAMQNGFYSSPYSIATNRMIAQTSITPFIAASPVSTYQVQSTSWMPHQQYVMQPTGAVITPAMDHTMSMQPASMMGPITQQMNHLSLGTTGSYMTAAAAAAPMQGTYIPQYTPVPPTAVPVEGVVTDASPQTVAPSSQEVAGQQQQIQVDSAADHVPAYSYTSK
ncbi:RNA-binding motif%2C single-stranded-interacting protein 3 isoform X4 [Xyrichtys novacula]|uniref:RNA-binding motif, single-stranded-interacting protein 3 isoform X4 n=1 Tax=Xyrichtys novacula TaxID=13765 RepID=A0AAV1HCB6_XYRNO|nr:RNA-binding motif%2C single-stranded-interacting protein 3 isoform X4 [Xyrichtys novacula]